jgi:hypothetical protein
MTFRCWFGYLAKAPEGCSGSRFNDQMVICLDVTFPPKSLPEPHTNASGSECRSQRRLTRCALTGSGCTQAEIGAPMPVQDIADLWRIEDRQHFDGILLKQQGGPNYWAQSMLPALEFRH